MITSLTEYRNRHNPDGSHPVTEVTLPPGTSFYRTPWILLRAGAHTVLIAPVLLDDHLSVDVTAFSGDELVTAGIFGMTPGRRFSLEETGRTSHGHPSAHAITILVGEQG